jgi:hypothetical protein
MVSAKGIAPVPGYVQVVKDWPMPTNRSEVRTFLGKTGYYCRFMENYAEVAGPLTDILKQDRTDNRAPFDQTSLRMKLFEQLKSNLLQAPILAYPMFDLEHPFILDTDWSQENRAVAELYSLNFKMERSASSPTSPASSESRSPRTTPPRERWPPPSSTLESGSTTCSTADSS